MGDNPPIPRDDRVLPFTRGLSLFITPFLLVAFVILYVFPTHTAQAWAWPIPVTMTSMVLASAYLGGAYFFLRVAWERQWHRVGAGFLAVTTFASLLGLATVLDWGKFTHDNVAFWLWAGLYFTAPFLVMGAWLTNRRHARPAADDEARLRPVDRGALSVVGAVALAQGLVMFTAPAAVIPLWPWPLTPLTCRVVGAVLCLGSAGIAARWDPRWSAVRLMLQVEAIMVTLMLLAAFLARDEMVPGRILTWPLLIGAALTLAGSGYLWMVHEPRRPRPAPAV